MLLWALVIDDSAVSLAKPLESFPYYACDFDNSLSNRNIHVYDYFLKKVSPVPQQF
jgi:hypothetical protein